MSRTINEQRVATFEITDCCQCGIEFGAPGRFLTERRADKGSFYCPNGHGMSFTESTVDRLKRDLTRAQDILASRERELEAERRGAIALRGQATKLRKRIANGVCPCCQRTFVNVSRHIATKHPDYEAMS